MSNSHSPTKTCKIIIITTVIILPQKQTIIITKNQNKTEHFESIHLHFNFIHASSACRTHSTLDFKVLKPTNYLNLRSYVSGTIMAPFVIWRSQESLCMLHMRGQCLCINQRRKKSYFIVPEDLIKKNVQYEVILLLLILIKHEYPVQYGSNSGILGIQITGFTISTHSWIISKGRLLSLARLDFTYPLILIFLCCFQLSQGLILFLEQAFQQGELTEYFFLSSQRKRDLLQPNLLRLLFCRKSDSLYFCEVSTYHQLYPCQHQHSRHLAIQYPILLMLAQLNSQKDIL